MLSRRLLPIAIVLTAVALVGNLGALWHAHTQLDDRERGSAAADLGPQLEGLQHAADQVAAAADLVGERAVRQELALDIVRFDQELKARGQANPALDEAVSAWHEVGPNLADLAAGEFSAASAAGQKALDDLHAAAPAIEEALVKVSGADSAGALAQTLAAAAGGLLPLLVGALVWTRRRPARAKAPDSEAPQAPDPAPRLSRSTRPVFTPAVDLDIAGASVDQVVVDMHTIASSTAKMQDVIEAVASALQGMLFSLNEMAQDTGEGVRITRTANNAATYTAEAARDLVATAREMAQVIGRVQRLAQHSQDIARQIEDEARRTGATGEAFTSVVATEVRELARATSTATAQIERTVDEIGASQRRYEETIGQVIKNILAIHRVAAHLGELMLEPPATVQPGAVAPVPAAVYTPPPPLAPPPPPPAEPVVTPVEARAMKELDLETADLIEELAAQPAAEPAAAPPGSNSNVFILNSRKNKTPAAPPAAAVEPAPAPEPAASLIDEIIPGPAASTPEEAQPELVPAGAAPAAAGKTQPVGQGASRNIFILNKKK